MEGFNSSEAASVQGDRMTNAKGIKKKNQKKTTQQRMTDGPIRGKHNIFSERNRKIVQAFHITTVRMSLTVT